MRIMSYSVLVEILFVLCLTQAFDSPLKEGDSCSLKSGAQGLCKFLTYCEPALKIIDDGNYPQDICGARGIQMIVCCEDTSLVKKRPSKSATRVEIPPPQVVTELTTTNRKAGDISKKKCKEYAKFVWDDSQAPTLAGFYQASNTYECSFEKLPLIVGGSLASRQEFPHMALIGYTEGDVVEWSCGGSLISENYVLTASHCLERTDLGLAKLVRVGITNQSDTSDMQQLTISEVRYHPEYNHSTKANDIALLKLSKDVKLNTYARPACLHTKKEVSSQRAIATGWGYREYVSISRGSNNLLKVVLDIFDPQACNASYKHRSRKYGAEIIEENIMKDLIICAGSYTDIKDTCQGDSGGPLQVYYEDSDLDCMYDIIGVTSFGRACGLTKNAPGVYTRVSPYIKWIEDVVWPESL